MTTLYNRIKLGEGRHIEIPRCCTHHDACDCRQAIVNHGVELVCRESMVALEKIEDAPCSAKAHLVSAVRMCLAILQAAGTDDDALIRLKTDIDIVLEER